MKVNISRKDLRTILQIASKVVPGVKTPLQILRYGWLETQGDQLILAVTDLDQVISLRRDVKVIEHGAAIFPVKKVFQFVNRLPMGEVTLTYADGYLSVARGRYKATFSCVESLQDFPSLVKLPELEEFGVRFGYGLANSASRFVPFAASRESDRPVLCCASFAFDEHDLDIVAADGYRMSVYRTQIEQDVPEVAILVPASSLEHLNRMLRLVGVNGSIAMHWDDTRVYFWLGDSLGRQAAHLICPRVAERFPRYKKILPTDHQTSIVVSAKQILAACVAAEVTARDEMVLLQVNGDCQVVGRSDTANSTVSLESTVEGGSITIAFKSGFLKDVLKVLGTHFVTVEFNKPSSPAVFRSVVASEQFIHCIMPMHNPDY